MKHSVDDSIQSVALELFVVAINEEFKFWRIAARISFESNANGIATWIIYGGWFLSKNSNREPNKLELIKILGRTILAIQSIYVFTRCHNSWSFAGAFLGFK